MTVTLAAEKKSMDTFYLIQITKENTESMVDDIDDYGHRVNKGVMHLHRNFLEKKSWF